MTDRAHGATAMSEPMSDEAFAAFRKTYTPEYSRDDRVAICLSSDLEALFVRIAAVEAERDAAVAKLGAFVESIPPLVKDAQAEGERRATAAIVADLRKSGAMHGNSLQSLRLPSDLADRYERGDHLPKSGERGEIGA